MRNFNDVPANSISLSALSVSIIQVLSKKRIYTLYGIAPLQTSLTITRLCGSVLVALLTRYAFPRLIIRHLNVRDFHPALRE